VIVVSLLFLSLSRHISAGVGKTCLLLRYASDNFSPTFIATIGVDFRNKYLSLDGKRIKLQVRPDSIEQNVHSVRDLGHCWTRKVPIHHDLLLPRSSRHLARLRCDESSELHFYPQLDGSDPNGPFSHSDFASVTSYFLNSVSTACRCQCKQDPHRQQV
jgi:hypothetical protein